MGRTIVVLPLLLAACIPTSPDEGDGGGLEGGVPACTFEGDVFKGITQEEVDGLIGCESLATVQIGYGDSEMGTYTPSLATSLASLRYLKHVGDLRIDAPGLGSLSGLEGLLTIASLVLVDMDDEAPIDLAPIRGLRAKTDVGVGLTVNGGVRVASLAPLADLVVDAVSIAQSPSSSLLSLEGLALKSDVLFLSLSGFIPDTGALSVVETAGEVYLTDVDDSTLASLSALQSVSSALVLRQTNGFGTVPAGMVTDFSLLSSLVSAAKLDLRGLLDVTALDLSSITARQLVVNGGPWSSIGLPTLEEPAEIDLSALLVTSLDLSAVGSVAKLRLTNLPALSALDLSSVEFLSDANVEISDLDAMTTLGHPAVASLSSLVIDGNLALEVLSFPMLTDVSLCAVTFNAALPQSDALSFAENLTADFVKVAGNLDDVLPHDPCPWPEDRVCDEVNGLCLTDANDCAPPTGQ